MGRKAKINNINHIMFGTMPQFCLFKQSFNFYLQSSKDNPESFNFFPKYYLADDSNNYIILNTAEKAYIYAQSDLINFLNKKNKDNAYGWDYIDIIQRFFIFLGKVPFRSH